MNHKDKKRLRPDKPVEIADRVYWVGSGDSELPIDCNSYLIISQGKGVLIDGGSRSEFPQVVTKILQAGISPEDIVALIYHHPDPDLCGSLANLADLCNNPNLRVISADANKLFISFYLEAEQAGLLKSVEEMGSTFTWGGRTLAFFQTPYAHAAGSFVTYDETSRTVFTSDLFGSSATNSSLFLELKDDCRSCPSFSLCPAEECPLNSIEEFHRNVMPCSQALRHALAVVQGIEAELFAPQHGSIIIHENDRKLILERLNSLDAVGIERVTGLINDNIQDI